MVDNRRFPQSLIAAVHRKLFDGQAIVETCKLVLSQSYTDTEYDQLFFDVLNVILDDVQEGVSFSDIENIYKDSFINSISEFRGYFSI